MSGVKRTVGVYERPKPRAGLRAALVAGALAVAAIGAAAAMYFF
jgi:hypothetical protein